MLGIDQQIELVIGIVVVIGIELNEEIKWSDGIVVVIGIESD